MGRRKDRAGQYVITVLGRAGRHVPCRYHWLIKRMWILPLDPRSAASWARSSHSKMARAMSQGSPRSEVLLTSGHGVPQTCPVLVPRVEEKLPSGLSDLSSPSGCPDHSSGSPRGSAPSVGCVVERAGLGVRMAQPAVFFALLRYYK